MENAQEQNRSNTINQVYYEDNHRLRIVFTSLIINVNSINQQFGSLRDFENKYHLGGITNGELIITAEMCKPANHLYDDPVFWEDAITFFLSIFKLYYFWGSLQIDSCLVLFLISKI